jgi:hypothetical protein
VLLGRRTVNTEPLPGSLVTVTSPPKVCRIAGFCNPSALSIQIRRDVPFVKTGCYEQYYTDAAA